MQLLELGHKTMVYAVYTNLDLTFSICQDVCTQIAYLRHVSFITPKVLCEVWFPIHVLYICPGGNTFSKPMSPH